ncbi:MAG: metalloregulator ArsR/SmtB family transcription factor [Lachnospiraceae bacterium]|nr:metalloregulator ArsR/SmtB family transcription factor [Lachnospiraceae bacterium]
MSKKYIVQARVFKAMSDENRLKILELLRERDYNASELLDEMDFGQSTLSHHMKILLNAGVVQARKNGKWTYYTLQRGAYEQMIDWMKRYVSPEE